jgi:hypothetical protein
MNKRIFPLLVFSSFLVYNSRSQSIDSTLNTYAEHYGQEKIHIHFDKDAYLPGETIWMKAYVLSGSKPSTRSKNIYFDWTDNNGNLLFHSSSPITESVSTSSFFIPAGFRTGVVHVRAYTPWMMNFDGDFLFNKDIPVLSIWDGKTQNPEKPIGNIRFFPEGGDLVCGLPSVVAFEAKDQFGKPLSIKGLVRNSENEILDSFTTIHEGMGVFNLRPQANEKYMAVWADDSGQTHTTQLPLVKTTGVVMRVKPFWDKIYIHVERPADCTDDYKSLSVRGISHDKSVYVSTLDLKNLTSTEISIPAEQLPDGVNQLTVFDASGNPLAERVIFINNHQFEFNTLVNSELVGFGKKERNEISIEVPDSLGANLSVSVTDGGLGYDSSNNIIADFLLNSDIRGGVVDPAYYFSNNSDSRTRSSYLDLVMRTHGWRRFKWEEIIAGKLPAISFPQELDYLAIRGRASGTAGTFDKSDSIGLLMITKDHKKHMFVLPVGADGSFGQKGFLFYDSMQVLYRFNHPGKLGPNAAVSFQTNLLPASGAQVRAGEPSFQWLKVPDVVLEKEMGGELTELYNYARQAAGTEWAFRQEVRKDSLKSNVETALHYLQSNFPNLKFAATLTNSSGSETRYAVYTPNPGPVPTPGKANVTVLLDGVEVSSDELKQISTKEILFIKFGDRTGPGKGLPTLSITSRQSLEQNNIINNKTGLTTIKGYTPSKEFYSSQNQGPVAGDQDPDLRTTLYWNPMVQIDKDHRKFKCSFYNNDISNKFRVVVEGINKEGRLTRVVETITK